MNMHIVVVQSLNPVLLFVTPMACSTSDFPILHYLSEFAQTLVHWVSDTIHLILYRPLLLSSVFPSITVFSNESVHIRWPKYWRFSISPCNVYSGLISFRMDWFGLLAVQEILKSLLQHQSSKASINSLVLSLLYGPTLTSVHDYW